MSILFYSEIVDQWAC